MSVFVPDTHALLWFLAGSSRLSTEASDIFRQERAKEALLQGMKLLPTLRLFPHFGRKILRCTQNDKPTNQPTPKTSH
jgi:hypothetical protein